MSTSNVTFYILWNKYVLNLYLGISCGYISVSSLCLSLRGFAYFLGAVLYGRYAPSVTEWQFFAAVLLLI